MIVARHDVLGTAPSQKSRPVGYGMISRRPATRFDDWSVLNTRHTFRREIPLGLAAPDHTVPYGTVPSMDDFPGTSCQATIMLSLWDVTHSQRRGFD
jgi:hypothetical protein